MSYHFDRKIYFDAVRASLFAGRLTQQQVDGQNFILDVWEAQHTDKDLRWLGYPLATTLHETATTCWPIEEYGKGAGHSYGQPDPVTGKTYYGRSRRLRSADLERELREDDAHRAGRVPA